MVVYQTELCNLKDTKYADFFVSLMKECIIVDGKKGIEEFNKERQIAINKLEEKAKTAPDNIKNIKSYFLWNGFAYLVELSRE